MTGTASRPVAKGKRTGTIINGNLITDLVPTPSLDLNGRTKDLEEFLFGLHDRLECHNPPTGV